MFLVGLLFTLIYYVYKGSIMAYQYITKTYSEIGSIRIAYTDASDIISISDTYIDACERIFALVPETRIIVQQGIICIYQPIKLGQGDTDNDTLIHHWIQQTLNITVETMNETIVQKTECKGQ